MSDFVTASPAHKPLEINKRVNYTLGLVLGVDEFDQEQYYFLESSRQHNRALHGYGTMCGLGLTIEGTQVLVTTGLALNPQGKVIYVARDQCADLADWLSVQANRQNLSDQLAAAGGLPIDQANLYVTLCYRECKSDKVPVPGAPCRSEEDNLDFSRRTETFELKLETAPPAAEEEQAVRRFGRLLRRLEIGGGGPFVTDPEIAEYVRDLLLPQVDSLTSLPESLPGSLPEGPLLVRPEELEDILRTAFRVWVTEVRPQLLAGGKNCGGIPDEDCILLGSLQFGITIDWKITPDPITLVPAIEIDETQRPYLLHTRLLQEWFMPGGGGGGTVTAGDIVNEERAFGLLSDPGFSPDFSRADHTHGTPDLPAGPGGAVPGDTVQEERAFSLPSNPGDAAEFSRANHTHGTPDLPALVGDVNGGIGANSVDRIRGVDVSATAPNPGQVLTFQGGSWQPAAPPAAAGDFVQNPPGFKPFFILAAGIVDGNGASRTPVFNNLIADASADGELTVTFDEINPPAAPMYIVKVLPVFNQQQQQDLDMKFPLVALDKLTPGRFTLFVTDLGTPIPMDKLRRLEFAIEVSRFE